MSEQHEHNGVNYKIIFDEKEDELFLKVWRKSPQGSVNIKHAFLVSLDMSPGFIWNTAATGCQLCRLSLSGKTEHDPDYRRKKVFKN